MSADAAADLIADDKVVLWFQGRMEYGPRALGHRSVLARPDRPALRDRINLLLKRRVWYQPFCPSMLENDARAAVQRLEGPPNRHMTMAYMVAPDTARRWRVSSTWMGRAGRRLFVRMHRGRLRICCGQGGGGWGIGAVLNTQLNIHGEPLVHTPAEAISVFQRSDADALVLGSRLVTAGTRQNPR